MVKTFPCNHKHTHLPFGAVTLTMQWLPLLSSYMSMWFFIGTSVMIIEIVYRFCQYFCIKGGLWTKTHSKHIKALCNTNFPMLSMAGSIWFPGRYISRYQNLTWIVFRCTLLIPARERGRRGGGKKTGPHFYLLAWTGTGASDRLYQTQWGGRQSSHPSWPESGAACSPLDFLFLPLGHSYQRPKRFPASPHSPLDTKS